MGNGRFPRLRIRCETCRGFKRHPKPLPYYPDETCNNPWHPIEAWMATERGRLKKVKKARTS